MSVSYEKPTEGPGCVTLGPGSSLLTPHSSLLSVGAGQQERARGRNGEISKHARTTDTHFSAASIDIIN